MTTHEIYMHMALEEARKALAEGEIPVGAVLVKDGQPICRAHNLREQTGDPAGHAEILCMREGAQILGDWRLRGCTLYVTLEPCPMCAGAMTQCQLEACVFGAADAKMGCCGSVYDLPADPAFGAQTRWTGGVLAAECTQVLAEFFHNIRSERGK